MIRPVAVRAALIAALLAVLEIACRTQVIARFTMIPPSAMLVQLAEFLWTGRLYAEMVLTFSGVAFAAAGAIVAGFATGVILHAWPRARRAVDPYVASYYSVPIFIFYPLFIVLFGLNRIPIVLIGFLLGVVVMITNTLNGLDRVPRVQLKSARVMRIGPAATIGLVVLPSAFPSFLTGAKFAIAYSFVGVLGSEFIVANRGLGYHIGFAFNDFDNAAMYAMIVLVLIVVAIVNTALFAWERRVLRRRGLT